MENTQQSNDQALEPGQAAAKAAVLAECDRLAAAGVTFVAVHFDGCGDSGATEDVKCYDSEQYAWEMSIPSNTRLRIYKTTSKLSFLSAMKTIPSGLGTSCSMLLPGN
jgi:hypothetical protein